MIHLYFVLTILGVLLPMSQFVPWLFENGLNISKLVSEAAQLRIGAFAWLDVLVSAIVLISFIVFESRRVQMKYSWLPIISTCTVGVSFGLPLFLFMRELHLKRVSQ